MNKSSLPTSLENLLNRPVSETDTRITNYLETVLYQELMLLKKAGISIKKVINVAVSDFLLKHNII